MRIRNPFLKSSDKELKKIENMLSSTLNPVDPRPDFKIRLRSQLIGGEIVIEEKQILGMDVRNFYTLLIIAGFLIGGGIVLVSGAWIVLVFMFRKGWLDWVKGLLKFGKNQESTQTSLPTA